MKTLLAVLFDRVMEPMRAAGEFIEKLQILKNHTAICILPRKTSLETEF